jgi:flagellar hook-associated protein 3 FlgL
MRIATSTVYQSNVNLMLDKQAKLAKTQEQLSSGQRLLSPQDDPVGAARVLDLNREISTVTQHQSNADAATASLSLEDSTLADAVNLVQRARELTVQAANGTLTASDRQSIGHEIQQLRDQLIGLANTQDANGDYLFSGFQTDRPAFTEQASAALGNRYQYNGDQGQPTVRIAYQRQIATSDNGTDVLGHIPTQLDADGDGQADGYRSIMDTLDLLSHALDGTAPAPGPGAGNGQDPRQISNYLGDIDAALSRLLAVRAKVGARLNAIDQQKTANDDYMTTLTQVRSDTQDLDYTEAVSRYQQQLTALQASQQSFVKIQGLSLFNYL